MRGFSMLELEAHLDGRLPPERAAEIDRAAEDDAALRDWLASRRALAEQLDRDPRAKPFAALVEAAEPPRSRAPWLALAALAVGAAVFVVMPRGSSVRVRGGVTVRAMVLEDGRTKPLASGTTLDAGSRVRLKIEDAVGGYPTVLLQESSGRAQRVYDANELGRIDPPGRTLPEALELDDHVGRERLYVVLCGAEHETSSWARALEAEHAERGFDHGWTPPEDCRLGLIDWEKRAP